ncbi:twin-arginine translocase TatA/TatE family subunit [Microbacterium sp. Sa4CUA7]|uniref:Sec-independent protein translocase protein TatA n=1 Tax=Microbacterium pullorum TaxID=2762236 RepID=A0ABR8S382_9MICO|nr:twin-arginine translocase TatA/TatE family subunit [Microbacterium pullorum]MBD7957920.1 twin-arginine translocase TatA/TatE family subunit [Microbacterium pullorum]
MGNAFGWPHLLIILAVILLLFGAAKLPALAKSVGQSARVFKGEMKAMKEEDGATAATTPAAAATPPAAGTANSTASPTVPDSTSGPSEPKP